MLNQNEILDRIHSGKTKSVKRGVKVQYDSRIQLPIDFWFKNYHHEILEVIFTKKLSRICSEFLVRTNRGIFNLKFYYLEINFSGMHLKINCLWKLDFQVIE